MDFIHWKDKQSNGVNCICAIDNLIRPSCHIYPYKLSSETSLNKSYSPEQKNKFKSPKFTFDIPDLWNQGTTAKRMVSKHTPLAFSS